MTDLFMIKFIENDSTFNYILASQYIELNQLHLNLNVNLLPTYLKPLVNDLAKRVLNKEL